MLSRFKEPEAPSKRDLIGMIEDKRSYCDQLQDKLTEAEAVIEEWEDELNHM
jgi:hypothetical protein